MKNNKKITIIIVSIILVLVVAGISLTVLYLKTDFMKSDRALFSKYIAQDMQVLGELTKNEGSDTYKNFVSNNNYESNVDVKVGYSEGGEVSNPINNLSMKVTSQRDRGNNYFYSDAQLLYSNEEYLEMEILKDQKTYGIRFSDVVKQFFSLTDDENLDAVAKDLGMNKDTIYSLFDILDGNETIGESVLTEKEIEDLKTKYSDLIAKSIDEVGTYNKQKNAVITVNNTSTKANAYTISLTGDQLKSIIIKVLNEVKNDETINKVINKTIASSAENIVENSSLLSAEENMINQEINNQSSNTMTNTLEGTTDGTLTNTTDNANMVTDMIDSTIDNTSTTTSDETADDSNASLFSKAIDELIEEIQDKNNMSDLKITVYEKKGTTLRTCFEYGTNKIIMDNSASSNETKMNLQIIEPNEEQVSQQNIAISKTKNSNGTKYNIDLELIDGDKTSTINITNESQQNDEELSNNLKLEYTEDINTISFEINSSTKLVDKIEHKTIAQGDNVILNNLNSETRAKILNVLSEKLTQKLNERIEALSEKIITSGVQTPTTDDTQTGEEGMSQVDVNRFNSKFEFYTGDSVSSDNVKSLLDNVKSNLKSVEFPIIESTENNGLSDNQNTTIKLYIEKDQENSELMKQVEARIEDNRQYKVSISYKDGNGIIDYITITEVK